jgi:hypothetical protein
MFARARHAAASDRSRKAVEPATGHVLNDLNDWKFAATAHQPSSKKTP